MTGKEFWQRAFSDDEGVPSSKRILAVIFAFYFMVGGTSVIDVSDNALELTFYGILLLLGGNIAERAINKKNMK